MTTYTCNGCDKTSKRADIDDVVLHVRTEWILTFDGMVCDGGNEPGDQPEDDLHFCDWDCLSVYAADVRDKVKGRAA